VNITLTARVDALAREYMSDRVVLKPLTRWNEAYKEFPRYVMEYLCARYVDPGNPIPGQQRIDRLLSEHYAESEARELIKSRIKERSEYVLLGQLQVRLDQARDHYWAEVPALGDNFVRISPRVLADYGEALLAGGAWGTMNIEYDSRYELKGRIYPFFIREFRPFQITRLDLDDYIEKRRLFDTDTWIGLLVQSIGFNPDRLSERERWLMLLRLVPFVEANYNLIELGPPQHLQPFLRHLWRQGHASHAVLQHRHPQDWHPGLQGRRLLRRDRQHPLRRSGGDDQCPQGLYADRAL